MRNTYLLLTLGLLGFSMSSQAQITVTNTTFPVLGDTLYYAFDTSPDVFVFTPPGGNQNWDFSSLTADFTQRQIFTSPSNGTAGADFPGANLLYVNGTVENYLQVTNQEVRLLGYYGADPVGIGFNAAIRYNPPIVERRAPIQFFDIKPASSGVLFPFHPNVIPDAIRQRLPFTPDSLRIRIAINRTDVVDGYGNLTIPGGTYPVLREKRTQYREARLDAKVPPLGWLDVTDVAIQAAGLSSLGVDTTVTYNFFNNTSKEPIAIVTLNSDQATPRLVQYKSNRLRTDVTEVEAASPQVLAFPNPAAGKVQFRLNAVKAGQYRLKLYNVLGIEVFSENLQMPGGQFEMTLDLTKWEAGTYFYNLMDSQGIISATKQLVILK
ncbi:MAG: T9SS type A sorting domain-containing protein [Saprospiraceae bacterium]